MKQIVEVFDSQYMVSRAVRTTNTLQEVLKISNA